MMNIVISYVEDDKLRTSIRTINKVDFEQIMDLIDSLSIL